MSHAAGLSSEVRRRLLKVVGAFFLGNLLPPPMLAVAAPVAIDGETFAAFLNVLLPRDELSGSATDLAVDKQLWAFAATDERFMQLLLLGCRWLNMTGQARGFADLSAAQQVAVVSWMAESDWQQIPRRFYELARQAALEVYFSQPAVLAGMPLQSAPQPLGYLPPWT